MNNSVSTMTREEAIKLNHMLEVDFQFVERLTLLVDKGILTPNEVRYLLGLRDN